ncbi:mitogen-activated protein kinase kinase kinase 20-like [Nicotiana sylvestris]|uniref:Mitogen-activated protein kinase kinase kinase ANP1-like n=1 Tax=Nicotiana tabacum TaxID=4097 RepID=A0A1S4B2Y5_TOBAC|nr:PREDICTED: mitogen-activated protein kinase kinase kinase ANP1-like [Nicotiana tabacum]
MWKRGRTLGKGGFGFVSLASSDDTNFTATVHHCLILSLIVVKSSMFSHSESLQVEREFLHLFEDSPHVIRSFDVKVTLEDGVLLYNLLLEYTSDGSLADRLNCSGKGMPEVEVKKHTKSVVLGLIRIHGVGIIHCDINPHNVLLITPTDDDTTEIAKTADFGLAMTLEQSWTQKQGLRGTKRYMAPEFMLKREYGPKADIWALGCTVYELITRTPQWESSNSYAKVDDVLYRIGYEEPSFENAKLSAKAKDFVRSCLVKNPSSRWTTDMLLNHSFLKSANNVQPATKTRKKQCGYMSLFA